MTRYRVELVELVEADSAELAIERVSSQTSYHGAVATPLDDTGTISRVRKRNALLRALGREANAYGGQNERAVQGGRRRARKVRRDR